MLIKKNCKTKIFLLPVLAMLLLVFSPQAVKAQGAGVGGETNHSGVTGEPLHPESVAAPPTQSADEKTAVDINKNAPELQVKIGNTTLVFDTVGACPDDSNYYCIGWLGQYIGVIYNYAMFIAAILATVMIMIGGFLWLTSAGDSGRVGKAKEFIIAALSGLLLALFSYLILFTLNPRLVNLEPLRVKKIAEIPMPPPETTQGSPSNGPGGAVSSSRASTAAEQQARNNLASHGIATWESGSGQTNVSNLPPLTQSFLVDRANSWGGNNGNMVFTITGGAEERGRHGADHNTVDIDLPNSNFSNFITQGNEGTENIGWGQAYYQDNVMINGQPYTVMGVYKGGDASTHIHTEVHPNGYRYSTGH